jgi:uncharacterized membrane protein
VFEGIYRNRLTRDLPYWQEQGWISPEGAEAILKSLPVQSRLSLSGVVAVLGALLIGAGVLAFIGANWEGMAPFVRFVLLVLALGACYGLAASAKARNHPYFSEALLLLAGLVFGGAIALIGQAYHLAGEFRDAVLLWTMGCLLGGTLIRSVSQTVLAIVGCGLWAWYSSVGAEIVPHWPSLGLLLVAGAVAVWLDSSAARRALILALVFWIAMTLILIADEGDWPYLGVLAMAAGIGLFLWGLATLAGSDMFGQSLGRLGRDMLWPALISIMAALFIIQLMFEDRHDQSMYWLLPTIGLAVIGAALAGVASLRGQLNMFHALVGLAIVLAAAAFAWWQIPHAADMRHGDYLWSRLLIGALILAASLWLISLSPTVTGHDLHTIGLAAFGLEILYVYTVTLGTLIDTALAFFVGGGLLIALSYVLFRADRWIKARNREVTG